MGSQWVIHTPVEVADHLSLKSRSVNSDDLQVEKKRAEQGGAAAVAGEEVAGEEVAGEAEAVAAVAVPHLTWNVFGHWLEPKLEQGCLQHSLHAQGFSQY